MSASRPSQASQRDAALLSATIAAAAERAAAVIRGYDARRATLEWREKAPTDFVSDADQEAERVIREVLADRYPGADVVGEEGSPDGETGGALVFIVDPLDGTTNFLHGYPEYAVSIAAVRDGELVAGVVLNVPTAEQFTAVAGGGAYRNGEAIRVSPLTEPGRSLVGTGFPRKTPAFIDMYLPQFAHMIRHTAGVRRAGAAALDLADVASGRLEAFWELRLSAWDVAAGILLVREAGGIATDLDGAPSRVVNGGIVAGNPVLHAWLLRALHSLRDPAGTSGAAP